jgi:UDP-GlcNAc:undecaprenyl-phosphate GlcNAc-1-phosphate transferase
LWFNLKNKIFLGDSGTLLLSFIIGYVFIRSYNSGLIYSSDEIFLIMMIPGFELLRLAIHRIVSKKHPFKGDRNHIHHLIIDKKSYIFTLIVIQLLFFSPYILNLIIQNIPLVVFLFLLMYLSIIIHFFKLKK